MLPDQRSFGHSRYACIDGDLMFMGSRPGSVEDILMLTEAEVSVEGATVAISSQGMLTVYQTLNSESEAERWTAKVRTAAKLWGQMKKLTEAVMKQRTADQRQFEVNRADTGGTETVAAPAEPAKVSAKPLDDSSDDWVCTDCGSESEWVEMRTSTGMQQHCAALLDHDANSSWSWMRSLFAGPFGGPTAIMVA